MPLVQDPLFSAVTKFLERMVRQIHYEDFSSANPPDADPTEGESCSQYMADLKLSVQQVQSNVLMRLTCKVRGARPFRHLLSQISRVANVYILAIMVTHEPPPLPHPSSLGCVISFLNLVI